MTTLEFIAQVVSSAAWPAAIVIIVLFIYWRARK